MTAPGNGETLGPVCVVLAVARHDLLGIDESWAGHASTRVA